MTLELLTHVLPKRETFLNLEEKNLSSKLKGTAKGLKIFGFGIVEYYVKSESGRMIALWSQAYYVPVLPKDLCII